VTIPQLRYAGVGKWYGKTRILEDLNLEIGDGELFVLLGPSGCGKTTILRMTAGLQPLSAGEIYLRGEPISRIPPERRDVAMVFQDYALYPHMTVYDNMAFGLRRHGLSRAVADERIRRTTSMLSIDALLKRKPHQLSGGQQQRVALGRAIVRQPSLFLMDEPLSNLDAQVRSTVRTEIKILQRELGVTTLYVTHDQLEAMTLADRMAVLQAGVVQQVGPPLEIHRAPANEFVARFLANPRLNVVAGTIENANGMLGVRTQLGTFLWPDPPSNAPETGRPVRIGLRPEELKIDFTGDGEGRQNIRLLEMLGSDVLVFGGESPGEIVVRVGSDALPASPTHFVVRPRGSMVHVFDAGSGVALGHFVAS